MAFPMFSKYLSEKNSTSVISDYNSLIDAQVEEDLASLLLSAQQYNESLSENTVVDAFSDDEVSTTESSYYNLLNLGEAMGYVEIPKIQVSLPIYHGTGESVLEYGVGHLERTSLPVGGVNTHCVLSGHTGLSKAKFFDDLTEMEIGDIFYIHVLKEVLAYQVCDIFVVLPEETDELQILRGRDLCTLVTCTPYGINSHRLLVRGERVEYDASERDALIARYKVEPTATPTPANTSKPMTVISSISQTTLVPEATSTPQERMTLWLSDANRYISDHPEQVLACVLGGAVGIVLFVWAIRSVCQKSRRGKKGRRR